MSKDERKSRLHQIGSAYKAALPATVVMGLADIPKAHIEEATGGRVARRLGSPWKSSGKGRAKGKMIGRAAALSTMPLFLSGLKDIKSGDKDRKNKGTAKLVASAAGYGAIRGKAETAFAFKSPAGKAMASAASKRIALGKAGLGAAQSVALARSIVGGKSKEKKSPARAAVIGAGLGVLKGVVEAPLETGLKGMSRGALARNSLARGVGRGASGAVGGLVIDQVAKKMLGKKASEKTAFPKSRFARRSMLALAGIGAGGLVLRESLPVEMPARGGVMQMRRSTARSLKRSIRKRDSLGTIHKVQKGLQTGKIRYYKYPKGTSSMIKSFKKQAFLKKRGLPNSAPGPGPIAKLDQYLTRKPGATIPFALGTLAATAYGAHKVRRAVREARYRKAVASGNYPSGVVR